MITMAKDFHVVRVYGLRSDENYRRLGERVTAAGRRLVRTVHVYPFASDFVEEHPHVLTGINQSSNGAFVCPSISAGELARIACCGEYSNVRAFYSVLSREFSIGTPERRSVSMIPEADAATS